MAPQVTQPTETQLTPGQQTILSFTPCTLTHTGAIAPILTGIGVFSAMGMGVEGVGMGAHYRAQLSADLRTSIDEVSKSRLTSGSNQFIGCDCPPA